MPETAIERPPVIGLLIVDDHPVGVTGSTACSPAIPGSACSVMRRTVVTLSPVRTRSEPDVVLMDLRMPEMNGVTAIKEMADRGIRARVLVLTTFDTDSDVLPAIEAGATGYLLKDAPRDELFRAVPRRGPRGDGAVAHGRPPAARSGPPPRKGDRERP